MIQHRIYTWREAQDFTGMTRRELQNYIDDDLMLTVDNDQGFDEDDLIDFKDLVTTGQIRSPR